MNALATPIASEHIIAAARNPTNTSLGCNRSMDAHR
jgi:hypothetical protein